jgi:hypothetical protein
MINYIPILNDPLFFTGLAVFGCGFLALVLRGLFFFPRDRQARHRTGRHAFRFVFSINLRSDRNGRTACLLAWHTGIDTGRVLL